MTRAIEIIAPLGWPSGRTRLAKFISGFRRRGFDVRYTGWARRAEECGPDEAIAITPKILVTGGGYGGRSARLRYPVWMAAVFWHVLRGGKRDLLCLGWETAFPARIAAIANGSRVIFDDADRFSMLFSFPGPLGRLIRTLERWLSRTAFLHLVPGYGRYEWRSDRMMLVRNTPSEADLSQASSSPRPRPPADLVLYANGWLGETRGAPFLRALLEGLGDRKWRLILAGRLDSENGEWLIKHPAVDYAGEVDQATALSYYPASDLLFTFYDPQVPINRLAESNKWGDAVHMACPIVVNREVQTAKHLVDAGCAFAVPYGDVDELFELLDTLAANPGKRQVARDATSTMKSDYPLFDGQLDAIVARLEEE